MPTTPVFIDANVLLYAASGNPLEADKRKAAREILTANPVCFSVQVAQEFFVNATRKLNPSLSRADAIAFLDGIAPAIVVALDYEMFLEATKIQERFQISYWDAAVVAAAARLNCEVIYSEDLTDGQFYGAVKVTNPFRAALKI